jgi:hypothetical protein
MPRFEQRDHDTGFRGMVGHVIVQQHKALHENGTLLPVGPNADAVVDHHGVAEQGVKTQEELAVGVPWLIIMTNHVVIRKADNLWFAPMSSGMPFLLAFGRACQEIWNHATMILNPEIAGRKTGTEAARRRLRRELDSLGFLEMLQDESPDRA